jgi:hypothetical protein
VLLTDSFNDEPKRDDPAYATYTRYYTPGGRLTRYPDTPENRDYERLLAKLLRSQKVNIYGIGVQIDQSGRPIEQLPVSAPTVPETPEPTASVTPAVARPVSSKPPWLWIGLGAIALIGGLLALLPMLARPAALRILGGPAGPKDFQLKSGQTVRLGGDNANFAGDAYPVPGVAAPLATIRGGRGGQFTLAPAAASANAAPAAPPTTGTDGGPKVFHNGLPLEREAPLSYGDEVRVSVPDPQTGVAKDYRLKFQDPTKNF